MQETRTKFSSNIIFKILKKQESSVVGILAIMVIINVCLQGNFFEDKVLIRTVEAFAPLIIMAMGQAIVLLSGNLDLSAGNAVSLLVCIMVSVMKADRPETGIFALAIGLAAAVSIGLINGFGAGYLRIPSVIVTYATSYIWLGISLFLLPTPGGEAVNWFRAFYKLGSIEGVGELAKSLGSVLPSPLILIAIVCIMWAIVKKMKIGRYIYAVGSNELSAYQSGINPSKTKIVAYVLNAICLFIAALFFVGQNMSGSARLGSTFTLSIIAAPVLGGVALSGGRGSVYSAVVGALILSFTSKIIFFAKISTAYQTLLNGAIVIIALSAASLYSWYKRKSFGGGV